MKLAELFEARRSITFQPGFDVPELAEALEERCGAFVGAYRKTYPKLIYRGVTEKADSPFSGKDVKWISIRKNRQPVEMGKQQHEVLDKAFRELGLKATRSNSIFCTANKEMAEDWGKPHVIFVRDGWVGTVFQNKKEGYTFMQLKGAVAAARRMEPEEGYDYIKQTILDLSPLSFNTEAELIDVIKEGYEDILITGSSYIAIPENLLQRGRLFAALKIGGRGQRTVTAKTQSK